MVASFSSSAEGRYAPDVLQRRPTEAMWQLRSLHGPRPNEAQKRKMQWQRGRSCSRAHPKRESKPAVSFSPTAQSYDICLVRLISSAPVRSSICFKGMVKKLLLRVFRSCEVAARWSACKHVSCLQHIVVHLWLALL